MAEDTWRSIAVPLLECIHQHGGQLSLLSVEELSQRTGLEPLVVAELGRSPVRSQRTVPLKALELRT